MVATRLSNIERKISVSVKRKKEKDHQDWWKTPWKQKNNGGQKIIKLCKQTNMFLDVFHAPNQMQSISCDIVYKYLKFAFMIFFELVDNCDRASV